MQTGNLRNLKTREDRAQALLLGGAVDEVSPNIYFVHGSTLYTVTLLDSVEGASTCTCPDHEFRQVECKHIRACELYKESGTQQHSVREMVVA